MITQILINGLVAGSIWSLIAIGFSLVYSNTRFFHFAHGVVFTTGAYLTFLFRVWLGQPLFFSIPLAIALSTLLGCLMELSVYRPLRHKGASALILLLASLGIFIVLQNVISMVFGDDIKSIRSAVVEEGINILGARITPIQIIIISISLLLLAFCFFFLKYTKIGQAMRAVANDPELANSSGIESDRSPLLWDQLWQEPPVSLSHLT